MLHVRRLGFFARIYFRRAEDEKSWRAHAGCPPRPGGLDSRILPPLMTIGWLSGEAAVGSRVDSVNRHTLAMLGSAPPRNPHGGNGAEVFGALNLAGGVALQAQHASSRLMRCRRPSPGSNWRAAALDFQRDAAAPASSAFSTSSFTTLAAFTTSPRDLLATCSGNRRMRFINKIWAARRRISNAARGLGRRGSRKRSSLLDGSAKQKMARASGRCGQKSGRHGPQNDLFADGKPQASAVGLAVSAKASNSRSESPRNADPESSIFSDDFRIRDLEAEDDPAAGGMAWWRCE